jgi:hypothetical protein
VFLKNLCFDLSLIIKLNLLQNFLIQPALVAPPLQLQLKVDLLHLTQTGESMMSFSIPQVLPKLMRVFVSQLASTQSKWLPQIHTAQKFAVAM